MDVVADLQKLIPIAIYFFEKSFKFFLQLTRNLCLYVDIRRTSSAIDMPLSRTMRIDAQNIERNNTLPNAFVDGVLQCVDGSQNALRDLIPTALLFAFFRIRKIFLIAHA
jgi:hypothetical protein